MNTSFLILRVIWVLPLGFARVWIPNEGMTRRFKWGFGVPSLLVFHLSLSFKDILGLRLQTISLRLLVVQGFLSITVWHTTDAMTNECWSLSTTCYGGGNKHLWEANIWRIRWREIQVWKGVRENIKKMELFRDVHKNEDEEENIAYISSYYF